MILEGNQWIVLIVRPCEGLVAGSQLEGSGGWVGGRRKWAGDQHAADWVIGVLSSFWFQFRNEHRRIPLVSIWF